MRIFTHDTPTSNDTSANANWKNSAGWNNLRAVSAARLLAMLVVCLVSKPADAQNVDVNWDSRRAFGYLEKVCEIGPRVSGSDWMLKQQAMVI